MNDTLNNNWGFYGSSSAVVAIISCLVPGFSALFVDGPVKSQNDKTSFQ